MDFLRKFYLTVFLANINCINSDVEIKVATVCKLLTIPCVSLQGESVEVCCELWHCAAWSNCTFFHPLL